MSTHATYRRLRRMASAVVLAGIAIGASACGSSSSSSTTTTTGAAGTPTSSSTATTGGGGSTTTTSAGSGGSASVTQLESKLASGETATFVATYTVSGTENGVPNSGTFTLAHDGTNSLIGVAEKQGNFEEIGSGAKAVICSKSGAAWMCFSGAEVASLSAGVTAFVNIYGSKAALDALKAESTGLKGVTTSTSTFAGQTVTCITYHSTVDDSTGTFCVTAAGVIAEWKGTSSTGSQQMVLKTYSTSVPSSEFTPPATPTTIPTGT